MRLKLIFYPFDTYNNIVHMHSAETMNKSNRAAPGQNLFSNMSLKMSVHPWYITLYICINLNIVH
jgi:hypothetical protein